MRAILEAIPAKSGWLFYNANGKRITEVIRALVAGAKNFRLDVATFADEDAIAGAIQKRLKV